jgi:hypothetical protein
VSIDTTYTERWRQLKEARALAYSALPGSWQAEQRIALKHLADRYVELRMSQPAAAAR